MFQRRKFNKLNRILCLMLIVSFCLVICLVRPGYGVKHEPGKKGSVAVSFSFSQSDILMGKAGDYDTVLLAGGLVNPSVTGVPEVPGKTVNILIPSGAEVTAVSAVSEEGLIASGVNLIPVQPPRAKNGKEGPKWVEPDPKAYASSDKFPASSAITASGTQKMRGWHYAEVTLFPLRYVAAGGQLYLASQITVSVEYVFADKKPVAPKRGSKLFEEAVKNLVANPDEAGAAPALGDVGNLGGVEPLGINPPGAGAVDYLIITPQSLVSAFQPLANHRTTFNGWDCEIKTLESISTGYSGSDIQMKIRNCIIDYVNTKGTTFVVFGGDDITVPDRDCYCSTYGGTEVDYTVPTDMYFAGLDGTWDQWNNNGIYGEVDVGGDPAKDEFDKSPEVYVGRIPIRKAYQAEDYIKKVMDYDNFQDDYMMHKVLLGGWVCWDIWERRNRPSDPVCDGHIGFRETNHPKVSDTEYWMRRDYRVGLCDYGWPTSVVKILIDTLNTWDNNGLTVPTDIVTVSPANIVTRMSEGFQFVHQSSHGWPQGFSMSGDFSSVEAAQLTGPSHFCYASACDVGAFDHAEPAVCEALLRNRYGGSIVFAGTARTNYGGCGEWLQTEWFKVIGPQVRTNVADVFYQHKQICDVANCEYCRHIFYSMNLLGDPGLELKYLGPKWGAIPSPWVSADIGAVGKSGSANYNSSIFLVKGSGADIGGTIDEFRYVYKTLSGDGELAVRVDYQTSTDNWAKAGVMVRETLSADSRHAMMVLSAGNGTSFQYRTTAGGTTTAVTPADGIKVPYWVKIVRSGSTLTGYKSQYGTSWTQVGTTSISMASSVYIGMCVTSRNDGNISTAVFYSGAPDTTAPTPNPATWASAPVGSSISAVSMTATLGSDATGPIEYYFDETSGNPGGTDSGWQRDNSYTDVGLNPNTQYTYTVKMRDSVGNIGTVSSPASATTKSGYETSDNFDTAHDYLTAGTSGTIWDGFVGLGTGETVRKLNANIDRTGQLYLESANGVWVEPWDPLGPFIYKNVSGNFVATVRVTDFAGTPANPVNYNNAGLMARASKNPDQGGTGEDWVSIDYFPIYSCGNFFRSADNNVRSENCHNGKAWNLDTYMKVERVGDNFHLSSSVDGISWVELSCSPQQRPDLTGLAVQVGVCQATYSTAVGYAAFDNFKIVSEESGPPPCTPTDCHVQSIVCSTVAGSQGKKKGRATVTIYNDCGQPVANALVDGTFTGTFNETFLNVSTDQNGVAVFTTVGQVKTPAFTFCVTDVTHTLPYHSADNVETCDSY